MHRLTWCTMSAVHCTVSNFPKYIFPKLKLFSDFNSNISHLPFVGVKNTTEYPYDVKGKGLVVTF